MEIVPEYTDDIVSVGIKNTQQMSIGNAAHLFSLLSKNLYSNPNLAAIREIITNAWDSHIESGRTDVPIQITSDGDSLTVSDFGNGISRDDFMDLYGVVGGTSKQFDNRQTGGMGIGKMAPLAVFSHFSVRSHHDGIATTYHIEGPTIESGGVPTISEIVKTSTERTGLDVIFPDDLSSIRAYAEGVVKKGAIKAVFNGNLLPTIPDVPVAIAVNQRENLIRYGNLTYPVPRKINNSMESYLTGLIIQAEGGSINITPNREEIIFNEDTEEYLTYLCLKASSLASREYTKNIEKYGVFRFTSAGSTYLVVDSKDGIQRELYVDLSEYSSTPRQCERWVHTTRPFCEDTGVHYRILERTMGKKIPGFFTHKYQNKIMKKLQKIFVSCGLSVRQTKELKGDVVVVTGCSNPLEHIYNVSGTFDNFSEKLCRYKDDLFSAQYLLPLYTYKKIKIHTGNKISSGNMEDDITYIKVLKRTDVGLLKKKLQTLFPFCEIEAEEPEKKTAKEKGTPTARRRRKYAPASKVNFSYFSLHVPDHISIAEEDMIQDPEYYLDKSYYSLTDSMVSFYGVNIFNGHSVVAVTDAERSYLQRRATSPKTMHEFFYEKILKDWIEKPEIKKIFSRICLSSLRYLSNTRAEFFLDILDHESSLTDEDIKLLSIVGDQPVLHRYLDKDLFPSSDECSLTKLHALINFFELDEFKKINKENELKTFLKEILDDH